MTKSAHWYIDALDARGGLSFITHRGAGLASAAGDQPTDAVVFVGPPAFAAEPVADRATALAAGRGAFQLGLFAHGREVPFRTLEDAVEFVRRLYINTGGGDTGGTGPVVPPGPEGPVDSPSGEPPEPVLSRERSGADQVDLAQELMADVKRFIAARPRELDSGAAPVEWLAEAVGQGKSEQVPPRNYSSAPLDYALDLLLQELFRRYPTSTSRDGPVIWLETVRDLLIAAGRCGAQPRDPLALQPSYPGVFESLNELGPWRYGDLASWLQYYREWEPYEVTPDALELLGRLPVPMETWDALSRSVCPPAEQSLTHLLAVLASAPGAMQGKLAPYGAVLLVFCACLLAASDDGPGLRGGRFPSHGYFATRDVRIRAVLPRAARWLSTALPRRVFSKPVEALIEAGATLEYA